MAEERDDWQALDSHWAKFSTGVNHQESGSWSPPADPESDDACGTCMGLAFVSPAEPPPIGHPDFGQLIPCPTCSGKDSDEITRQYARLSGLSEGHLPQSFQTFDTQLQQNRAGAVAMLNAFGSWAAGAQEGRSWYPWVVVLGDPGIGKTHLCVAAMWRLARRAQRSLYMDSTTLAEHARSFDDGRADALHGDLTRASWLILDSLGDAHDPRGYVAGVVAAALMARYEKRLPTLITSNLTVSELGLAVDRTEHGRVMDRLNDASLVDVLVLHGDLVSVRPQLGGTDENK
jgi:DNA replication protein DnaC